MEIPVDKQMRFSVCNVSQKLPSVKLMWTGEGKEPAERHILCRRCAGCDFGEMKGSQQVMARDDN